MAAHFHVGSEPMQERTKIWAGFLLCLALAGGAGAQTRDEGPLLKPKSASKAKPASKPAQATLLVSCDVACAWKLDGEPKGRIEADDVVKIKVDLGEHLLSAATVDGLDRAQHTAVLKSAGQSVVRLALQPAREARLKREQEQAAQAQATSSKPKSRQADLDTRCDRGEMDSCTNLGVLYEQGDGVTQDYDHARLLYLKACDGGEMTGCKNAGYCYHYGLGVAQDYEHARRLYQKACNGGNLPGCTNLGALYANGQGVAQDYGRARQLFEQACDGGQMLGCNNLGMRYQYGQSVEQNYARARQLYQKACDGGEQHGCDNLKTLP